MARARSAGILLVRRLPTPEILLGHMGGPFWSRKDAGAWTIPKGLVDDGVDTDELAAARREFREEMGHDVPDGEAVDLGLFSQSRQKELRIWMVEGDLDASSCVSNTFEMEWPPKSGKIERFPEIDRAEWFTVDAAMDKVIAGQRHVLEAVRHQM